MRIGNGEEKNRACARRADAVCRFHCEAQMRRGTSLHQSNEIDDELAQGVARPVKGLEPLGLFGSRRGSIGGGRGGRLCAKR